MTTKVNRIIEMINLGKTYSSIANEVGVSKSRIASVKRLMILNDTIIVPSVPTLGEKIKEYRNLTPIVFQDRKNNFVPGIRFFSFVARILGLKNVSKMNLADLKVNIGNFLLDN